MDDKPKVCKVMKHLEIEDLPNEISQEALRNYYLAGKLQACFDSLTQIFKHNPKASKDVHLADAKKLVDKIQFYFHNNLEPLISQYDQLSKEEEE